MSGEPDILEGAGLWGARTLVFESLPSTNRWALDHLSELGHGDVVRAVRQTSGRGRHEREWIAPDDRGLALSVVLKDLPGDVPATAFNQAPALAVRDALAPYGLTCAVKWPNDVFVLDYKICGILAESSPDGVVVGIGLNVNLTDADFACVVLNQPATSMSLELGGVFDVAKVCADLVSQLQRQFDRLLGDGMQPMLDEWASCDWLTGFRVRIAADDGFQEGRYDGLTHDGRLILLGDDGQTHNVLSGDVERLMPDAETPD
jgi:BirA family biotin operon repressor/biotin-[acetyl-CoA-carboxylase] ligase